MMRYFFGNLPHQNPKRPHPPLVLSRLRDHHLPPALMLSAFILSIVMLNSLTGCTPPRAKGRWHTTSPTHSRELGLLVQGAPEATIHSLMTQKKIGARVLSRSSGTYEIYGLSEEEAARFFPRAYRGPNRFIPLQPHQSRSPLFLPSPEISDSRPPSSTSGAQTKNPSDDSTDHPNPPSQSPAPSPAPDRPDSTSEGPPPPGPTGPRPGDSDPESPPFSERLPQLDIIGAYEAWKLTRGTGAVVAVIDSGLSWKHHDFIDQKTLPHFFRGWNFGDDNDNLTDPVGHGTAVAGLIASNRLGVAPAARIVPLKVMNYANLMDIGTVVAAVRFALEKRIPLIHLSIATEFNLPVLADLVQDAEAQGALIIAAAGNGVSSVGESCEVRPLYPAALPSTHILSVGATVLDPLRPFQYASYSHYGPCVDLAAPGGTAENGLWVPFLDSGRSGYIQKNGTSMAAPLVTGAAALLYSLHPEWTGSEIREHLLQSSRKSKELEGLVQSEGLLFIKGQ